MNAGRSGAIAALLCSLALASGAGCARNQGLDVRYPEAGVNRALLASVPPQRVGISPVVDRRLDTSRIGSLPKDGRAIVTRRPVSDIVRDALTVEVSRNGHAVLPDAQDVVQETVVTVARKIKDFQVGSEKGSFKAWLAHTTKWRIADQCRKRCRFS